MDGTVHHTSQDEQQPQLSRTTSVSQVQPWVVREADTKARFEAMSVTNMSTTSTATIRSIVVKQDEEDVSEDEVSWNSEEEDEDEYEYTYVDSDIEEEEETQQQQQQQLCGVKRNASPSFPLKDNNTFAGAGAALVASPTTASPSIPKASTCPCCHQETHLPVTDCTLAETWLQGESSNSEIMVMNSKLLVPAMKKRIQECALQLDIPSSHARVLLSQNNWNLRAALESMVEEGTHVAAAVDVPRYGLDIRLFDAFFETLFRKNDTSKDGGGMNEEDAKPAARTTSSANAAEGHDGNGGSLSPNAQHKTSTEVPLVAVAQPRNTHESKDENRPRELYYGDEKADDEEGKDSKPPAVEQAPSIAAEHASVERRCQICLEDYDNLAEEDMMSMSCEHKFCHDCWRQFIEHTFNNSVLPDEYLQTTCPIPECDKVVTEAEIEQVAPHLLPEYQSRQLHSFVDGNRETLRWCVGPDCKDQIAVRCRQGLFPRREANVNVNCGACQTQFCFRCGQPPHAEDCEPDRAPAARADLNKPIKNCPKCKIKIEKNGGCNHMHCKCGCDFCWICLEAYINGIHFCGRERGMAGEFARSLAMQRTVANDPVNLDYVATALHEEFNNENGPGSEEVARVLHEKKEMDRRAAYMVHRAHYMTRFLAHEQGQRFAADQCNRLLEDRAVDFAKASDLKSATDTDFLAEANERLVAARRMLKWSYCYVFYLPDDEGMTLQKELFQNHQERLERFTENLSDISEHALSYDDRANIINLVSPVRAHDRHF